MSPLKVHISEDNIQYRGRVGPGQMISLDLDKGKYFNDKKTKDHLASNPIYKEFATNHIELTKSFKTLKEKNIYEGQELRQRQYLSGLSIEDLEMILHPMIEDAKEAVGSMGDDTPIAVLSSKYRPLSHFFRQNFSQVTYLHCLYHFHLASLRHRGFQYNQAKMFHRCQTVNTY